MSGPNKQPGPKSPQERKDRDMKTWGREGINISMCTDTFFFSGLGKWFCILHCPRCSVNYIVVVALTWGRAELCANIMIVLKHPGESCGLLFGCWANLYLSPTGRWGAEGRGTATVGTVDRSQGKMLFTWNASVCILVKINYHILNYNTIV